MRHELTRRFVLVASRVGRRAAGGGVVRGPANVSSGVTDRSEVILELDPNIDNGRTVYNEIA